MTTHEAYIFLGRPRGCDNKIKRLEVTIEALKCSLLPSGIRYDTDRVQTSPSDRMMETYARIDELERELVEENLKRSQAILAVDLAMDKMPDSQGKTILMEYYIGRISMPKIADGMGFTPRHCYRLRKQAMEEFCALNTEV